MTSRCADCQYVGQVAGPCGLMLDCRVKPPSPRNTVYGVMNFPLVSADDACASFSAKLSLVLPVSTMQETLHGWMGLGAKRPVAESPKPSPWFVLTYVDGSSQVEAFVGPTAKIQAEAYYVNQKQGWSDVYLLTTICGPR